MIHLVLRLPCIRPLTWTLIVGPLRLNFGPVALKRLFPTLSFPNIGLIASIMARAVDISQTHLNFEIHPRPAAADP